MVTHTAYGHGIEEALRANSNDLAASGTEIRVALLGSGHTPDTAGHDTWADVSGDEIDPSNHTGYSAGGAEVLNKSITESGTDVVLGGDDVEWTDSTITAAYAVTYDNTPSSDSEKTLLALTDFEGESVSEDGRFAVEWGVDAGVLTFSRV